MKKLFLIAIGLFLIMPSLVYSADVIEGTIQGFNCVTQKICASSSEDPLVTAEHTFVVVTPDGKIYFLPVVPRAVLAYRDTERIRVTGELSPKYNKISAKRVEIIRNENWRLVWFRDSEFNPIPQLN